jgi:hypothetical protein
MKTIVIFEDGKSNVERISTDIRKHDRSVNILVGRTLREAENITNQILAGKIQPDLVAVDGCLEHDEPDTKDIIKALSGKVRTILAISSSSGFNKVLMACGATDSVDKDSAGGRIAYLLGVYKSSQSSIGTKVSMFLAESDFGKTTDGEKKDQGQYSFSDLTSFSVERNMSFAKDKKIITWFNDQIIKRLRSSRKTSYRVFNFGPASITEATQKMAAEGYSPATGFHLLAALILEPTLISKKIAAIGEVLESDSNKAYATSWGNFWGPKKFGHGFWPKENEKLSYDTYFIGVK